VIDGKRREGVGREGRSTPSRVFEILLPFTATSCTSAARAAEVQDVALG
jgi:hypothetical protein